MIEYIQKKSVILNYLADFKKDFIIKKKIITFDDLYNWRIFKNKISDTKNKFFSILFLRIKTNSREVKEWSQPIISDHYISLNGFLVKVRN